MKLSTWFAVSLAGLVAAGCVMTEDVVSLNYTQARPSIHVQGAERTAVQVVALDRRSTDATRISVKIDGYGNKQGPVRTDKAVSNLVQSAVENELDARGFRLSGSKATVRVEILRFFNEFRVAFPMAVSEGQIGFNVQVLNDGEGTLYERRIDVVKRTDNVAFVTANVAKTTLEEGLSQAMAELMADRQFIDAVLAAGRG